MEQLAKALTGFVEPDELTESFKTPGTADLREAAVVWAKFCLQNLDGVLLKKGLAVSASIGNFLNENERGF